jgi:hypothetical protein
MERFLFHISWLFVFFFIYSVWYDLPDDYLLFLVMIAFFYFFITGTMLTGAEDNGQIWVSVAYTLFVLGYMLWRMWTYGTDVVHLFYVSIIAFLVTYLKKIDTRYLKWAVTGYLLLCLFYALVRMITDGYPVMIALLDGAGLDGLTFAWKNWYVIVAFAMIFPLIEAKMLKANKFEIVLPKIQFRWRKRERFEPTPYSREIHEAKVQAAPYQETSPHPTQKSGERVDFIASQASFQQNEKPSPKRPKSSGERVKDIKKR